MRRRRRRRCRRRRCCAPGLAASPLPASAAVKSDLPKAQQAYSSLREARQRLDAAEPLIKSKNWEGLDALLDAPPASRLEGALLALVTANVLDREDVVSGGWWVACGAARRCGPACMLLGLRTRAFV
jgi:hypothetical protein